MIFKTRYAMIYLQSPWRHGCVSRKEKQWKRKENDLSYGL